MQSLFPEITHAALLQVINARYPFRGERIRLYRESDGRVYFINCPDTRVVFKLFRNIHTDRAIQSAQILSYLDACGYPVVQVIPTCDGDAYLSFDTPQGRCIGILFAYATGRCIGFLHRWRDEKKPLIHPSAALIGRELGRMHRLMDEYPGTLIPKGRNRYIDDFIRLLRRDGTDDAQTRNLEIYGEELWATMSGTHGGFCHGDMHTGNTRYRAGTFTWMDFDRASRAFPILDIAWLSDGSDFNVFDSGAYDRSRELFDAVYRGYSQERTLSDDEIAAVLPCTAVIHYDLVASITIRENSRLRKGLVEEQYDWLMRWREACLSD